MVMVASIGKYLMCKKDKIHIAKRLLIPDQCYNCGYYSKNFQGLYHRFCLIRAEYAPKYKYCLDWNSVDDEDKYR